MTLIKEIVDLQNIDFKLQEIASLLGDLPLKVDTLKDEERSLIESLENGKNRLKELELELNKCDSSIEEIKQKIDKHKDQLFLVTTNKQYDALQLEIDHFKRSMDELETKLLELAEEKESLQEKTKFDEDNLDSLSNDLIQRREKLEGLMEISSSEKNKLEEERQSKTTVIAPTRISQYDKIYKARNGLAVVPIMGSACGGCGGFIPPQIVSEVRAGKGPHTCESCGRFLYFDSQ
ncbi:MAG: hypothetical protein CMG62_09890 [Candidatus Marinimicrobia bacterium]|nr:hypothetical protein [Candidatus Neomarinimicrobiota bacterium]|tara:strand:+ start:7385 stop:8089 length:705 start_codon:yes stop_codon:yes gene_type:complete